MKKLSATEVGRICVKIAGREAGRKCVILDIIDKNFLLITGPPSVTGIKRRRVNMNHIEPTTTKIDLSRRATDEETIQALTEADKIDDMKEIIKPAKSQLF